MINMKYWYYILETRDYHGSYNRVDGVAQSDNGLFPLREIEKRCNNIKSINYKIVIEISKEDYEWKYHDMSKLPTVVGRMDEILDRLGKGKGEIDG